MVEREEIKEIISDFHQRKIPNLTRREIAWKVPANKILSFMGVRRSGKTYSFYQIMDDLIEKGANIQDMLFINFEDDRLFPLDPKDLPILLSAYYELYPQKKDSKVYAFFDEVQNVPGWERFVRRVNDTENIQLYITGSSSKILSKELATTLRGRTIAYEVFPFSFTEYLDFKNIDHKTTSSKQKAKVVNAFNNYLLKGGFPEILDCQENERIDILQEYINLIIYKDLIERHNIQNHALVKYLIQHFFVNISSLLSINKLYKDLKSQGYKASKDSLFNYLSYLEAAYCFFSVPIFSESIRVQHVNPRKIYSIDHGLTTACAWMPRENIGRLLENLIYIHLRRISPWRNIFYYKTKNGSEVDFVVEERGRIISLIQVCATIEEKETRERETKALFEAMDELKISSSIIITRNQNETINKGKKKIHIIPAWRWLIEKRA